MYLAPARAAHPVALSEPKRPALRWPEPKREGRPGRVSERPGQSQGRPLDSRESLPPDCIEKAGRPSRSLADSSDSRLRFNLLPQRRKRERQRDFLENDLARRGSCCHVGLVVRVAGAAFLGFGGNDRAVRLLLRRRTMLRFVVCRNAPVDILEAFAPGRLRTARSARRRGWD